MLLMRVDFVEPIDLQAMLLSCQNGLFCKKTPSDNFLPPKFLQSKLTVCHGKCDIEDILAKNIGS